MSRRAFTLIELLIVVAIIGILAAIAIPNFLQAQVRAKVARAKAEMKTVATALEVYNVDQNQYPWINQNPGYDIPRTLTTPVDYLTSLPKDPFGPSMA
jgi:type II secretion system protein G